MTYHNNKIIRLINKYAVSYPTPSNLNYNWNWGVLALFFLGVQIVTGICLSMFYIGNVDMAYNSVERIMREINDGWLLRYVHANGASFFFIVIYAHICRGLIKGSYLYPRQKIWETGIIIFILMILSAFLGYVLPWGQMSLWAATVITSIASTLPAIGDDVVGWLWGGYSVGNSTLSKFYTFHFIIPFILLLVVLVHLYFLHKEGSSNQLGIEYHTDKVYFGPYYFLKDLYIVNLVLIPFTLMVCFYPDVLGHPDNYVRANSDVTPDHIVPEWYFLGFYAILRAIPNKTLGVIALFSSILILFVFSKMQSAYSKYSISRVVQNPIILLFVYNWVLLSYLGMKPIEQPYLDISIITTMLYFIFIFMKAIIVCLNRDGLARRYNFYFDSDRIKHLHLPHPEGPKEAFSPIII